ncbi:MAG: exonuclease SbcCD subunit D [Burkholderiaceae bacterium]
MTRLLHSADWHLGRFLHGRSLLDDQAYVLDQFVALARSEGVDAVIIAGDIYDRSVPPADAVALLDDVLARLVLDCAIPVLLIAGNHDSADRIGFGGRILGKQGLTVRGTLDDLSPVLLTDRHGTLAFHLLPYVDPVFARALPGGAALNDHQSAMTHVVSILRAQRVAGQRNVLVGHAFVAGGSESESERPLAVGGSGMVGADTFEGFDFVALGHLHQPQVLGSGRIHYPGSLLKYSFNEVDHRKGVSLVEIGAAGTPLIRSVALSARHDVRIVSGTLAELLSRPDPGRSRDDYLCAHLTDPGPVLDPMARLREVYPNMMELQFIRNAEGNSAARAGADHRRRQPAELFRAFYRDMVGQEIGAAELAAFNESVESACSLTQRGEA